jgi:hypothetical protein
MHGQGQLGMYTGRPNTVAPVIMMLVYSTPRL